MLFLCVCVCVCVCVLLPFDFRHLKTTWKIKAFQWGGGGKKGLRGAGGKYSNV